MTRAEQTLPHHAAGAPSDDAPSDDLPYRCQIRRFLEMIWVEKATMALVLVYMLLVLIDLVIEDLAAWSTFFLYTDFTFLCVFVAEHSIRFYAYGLPYLCAAGSQPSPAVDSAACAESWTATRAQTICDERL